MYRSEKPVLDFPESSVAIHVLTEMNPEMTILEHLERVQCPFHSMEMDLLSYNHQQAPSFCSHKFSDQPITATIVFPDQICFHSEGREEFLECPNPRRDVLLHLSYTLFKASQVIVWHFVFTPAKNSSFNEYDIIKLIGLYDGKSEKACLDSKISFVINNGACSSFFGMAENHLSQFGVKIGPENLKGGTVQLICRHEGAIECDDMSVFDLAVRLRSDDSDAVARRLEIFDGWDKQKVLRSFCGILTGIFDFQEIDPEEALDTIEPVFYDSSSYIKINRATIIAKSDSDRALRTCYPLIGGSPYLLIPHAVIIHNDYLMSCCTKRLNDARRMKQNRRSIHKLEDIYKECSDKLYSQMIPNVFNYLTERTIFNEAQKSRGSLELQGTLRQRHGELKNTLEVLWAEDKAQDQLKLSIILMVISILQLQNLFMRLSDIPWINWSAFIASCIGLSLVVYVINVKKQL